MALLDETSPAFVGGLFQLAYGTLRDATHIVDVARTGDGVSWGEHNADVHIGCERFFRPTYATHVVGDWIPALDGVVDKLASGAHVADVGCGHGASTILMAEAFPKSTFHGTDAHAGSIDTARLRGRDSEAKSRLRFETTGADELTGGPYDLVTMFDCLHDMGDPIGAARHIRGRRRRRYLDDRRTGGGDHVEDNFNPSAAPTTGSRRCCAHRRRWRSRSGWPSAHRPGPRVSGRRHRRGLLPVPLGGADPVQQCLRGPALKRPGAKGGAWGTAASGRVPDTTGSPAW